MPFRTTTAGPLPLSRQLVLTLAGAALIALSAKIQVPFWPVPATLQTLSVLMLAVVCGPRLGLAMIGSYLMAGLAGLPVFAGSPERGIGLAYAMGPTGGYLIGYLLAAVTTGLLAQGRGLLGQALAMLAGLTLVYVAGLIWLMQFVPMKGLLQAGFWPFILADLVKIALALALIRGAKRLRGLVA